jgi:hypothetical protein
MEVKRSLKQFKVVSKAESCAIVLVLLANPFPKRLQKLSIAIISFTFR